MNTSTKISGTIIIGAAVALAGACGGPEGEGGSGDAFLSIVGDRTVYVESGGYAELQVRYHDKNDQALYGAIDFAIEGDDQGAQLATAQANPNDDGVASVAINATNEAEASFQVVATAAGAGSVTWEITLEEPWIPLEPNGTYQAQSTFDLVSGLEEGTVRDVVHTVRDFTEEPGTFMLRLAIEACGSTCSVFSSVPETFGPALTTYLTSIAPDFVNELLDVGEAFFAIAHNFNVVSELTVEGEEGARSAAHQITGVIISHEGEDNVFTLAEMGTESTAAESVAFSMTDDHREISLGDHGMPIAYGAMLTLALEEVILPALDGSPNDLASFLHSRIDCGRVGEFLEEQIPGLPVTTFGFVVFSGEDLCELGINEGSKAIMNRIASVDDVGLELVIHGSAQPVSSDRDGTVDMLTSGRWEGLLDYGGSTTATLDARDNRFEAERLAN